MPPKLLALLTALVTALALLVAAVPAIAAPVPEGAEWKEYTITEEDGTKLHADVLRPAHLPADAKTPVILSIGPYFNHAGQLGALGAGRARTTTRSAVGGPVGPFPRPHRRRPSSWSAATRSSWSTCAASAAAPAAWTGPARGSRPTSARRSAGRRPSSCSDGNVGMYGKSYDGVTGLIGAALQPQGPGRGRRRSRSTTCTATCTPTASATRTRSSRRPCTTWIAGTPGPLADQAELLPRRHSTTCRSRAARRSTGSSSRTTNHDSAYWQERDLIDGDEGLEGPALPDPGLPREQHEARRRLRDVRRVRPAPSARGSACGTTSAATTPTPTAGCSWAARAGSTRSCASTTATSRALDVPEDPAVVVQTSDGSWRSEQAWPPADARTLTSALNPGTYTDDAQNEGTGEAAGNGIWTISPPLAARRAPRRRAAREPRRGDAGAAGERRRRRLRRRARRRGDPDLAAARRWSTRAARWTSSCSATTGSCPPGTASASWRPRRTPSGGCTSRRSRTSRSPAARSACRSSRRARRDAPGAPSVKLEEYREEAPFTVDAGDDRGGHVYRLRAAAGADRAREPATTSSSPVSAQAASAATTTTTAATTAKRKAAKRAAARKRPSASAARGRRLVITGRGPSGAELLVRVQRAAGARCCTAA